MYNHFVYDIQADAKSDQSPPQLELSGALTNGIEEETSSYPLHVEATDGEAGAPQSGVKLLRIVADEEVVDSAEEECPAGNCSLSLEWTYETSTYPEGEPHEVEVFAEDESGEIEIKAIELPVPDGDIPACKPLDAETPSPPSETNSLPGGGTSYSYVDEEEETDEFIEPPESFDPLAASAEELEEYGFPPKPEGGEELEEWEADMEDAETAAQPGACNTIYSSAAKSANAELDKWSGFLTVDPKFKDRWVAIQGNYRQLTTHRDPYCPGATSSSWVGLGGLYAGSLIQAGSYISRNGNLRSFYNRISPEHEKPDKRLKIPVHPNDRIHVYLNYQTANERTDLFFLNKTTHQYITGRHVPTELGPQFYDGITGDFIDERRSLVKENEVVRVYPRTNFHIAHWSKARVETKSGKWQKLGKANRYRARMRTSPSNVQLAAPGYLRPDGKSFRNNWFHCEPVGTS